jgi:hypothetical protein
LLSPFAFNYLLRTRLLQKQKPTCRVILAVGAKGFEADLRL